MGGGAGLSMHGRFKIVTEKTVFAMPEASIGLFPDVGASHFLSRLPGHFGEYLGLTGAKIDGAEMLACGLASHFIFTKDLSTLENELQTQTSPNLSTIYRIIEKFAQKPEIKENSAYNRMEIISKCFSKGTVEEILQALEYQLQNKAEHWILKAINSIKAASPISLKITLRSGPRSLFYDKGKRPKWEPSKLELVSKDMVDCHSKPIDEDDWKFLQLPDTMEKISNPKL